MCYSIFSENCSDEGSEYDHLRDNSELIWPQVGSFPISLKKCTMSLRFCKNEPLQWQYHTRYTKYSLQPSDNLRLCMNKLFKYILQSLADKTKFLILNLRWSNYKNPMAYSSFVLKSNFRLLPKFPKFLGKVFFSKISTSWKYLLQYSIKDNLWCTMAWRFLSCKYKIEIFLIKRKWNWVYNK